jgi:ADP-ribose pyrophosphatase YjhB (NUDIX family)
MPPQPPPPRPRQPHKSQRGQVRLELSAGGVAVRRSEEGWVVALLKTEHKRGAVWVLPKGHVELQTGENIAEAARREVQEEAGLRELSVKDQLGVTRFAFQAEGALVKKTVHYFLMITNQKQLTPQAEEGMIDAGWFSFDDAIKNLAYDTDQEIVAKAQAKIIGGPVHRPTVRAPRIHR